MAGRVARQSAWMRQAEAARLLGIARQTMQWRIAAGRYRTKDVHGLRMVRREDVEKDVEAAAAAA